MINNTIQFILVDDNEIDQLLNRKLIELVDPTFKVIQFIEAKAALNAIANGELQVNDTINIMLLDIKMPVMDGFQFLELYHQLNAEIKDKYSIYMLSSSLNQYDISRANNNAYVKELLLKPLSKNTLTTLLQNFQ